MPKVAALKFIQQQKQSQALLQNMAGEGVTGSMLQQTFVLDQTYEGDAANELLKDTAFSVYSDPKFLYLLGKLAARSQMLMYADMAIQSFHDYFLIVTYFKA